MRTLLVGLDAACLPVLRPLFDDGDLPTLRSLFDDGATAPLESQIPPWTASAWPSLYTGKNPGKHGVFDFLSFDGYEWDIVNSTDVKARTMWEYADEAGLTSVVVNAPVTDPPREFDGALVPGYLAAEKPRCHPDGLLDDIEDEVGPYRVYAERETDERRSDEAKFRDYVELSHLRGKTFRYLADRFDPEFGFVQFQKTDAVFHDFPGDQAKVRDIYRAVDEELAEILDACDPDAVVVASDHGMGEYDGYEFRVNQFLKEQARVVTARGGQDVPSWFQIKDSELTDESDSGEEDDDGGTQLLSAIAAAAARAGLTYQRGKAILDRVGLAEFVGRHVPVSVVFAASESVDFAASEAYLRSPSELGIRLNVEGREPDGTIPESEYGAVRKALIDELRKATTPDREPVFERVLAREDVFEGPYAEEAVDIVTVPTDFEHSLSALIGEQFGDPEPWNHKLDGVVSVSGTGVDTGTDLSDAHLFDIAPTVLATLGIAPDVEMDGRTLPCVSGPEATEYPEFDVGGRARTDDDEVASRLADLGYLE
ncbi:phosphodiesterase [Haloprofundus marisrubri]|uniref:Phosphodiesterase n=1 Tax=Haloprofundus marisrubri TaxID=1514971 RepID=A0A0W1RBL9_9EURY|nr:alkaline phosphatase family protein [Haloprofundus marisrubri]KTG10450.1 phosphodiesterase [Haloprofundus marisrubri]